MKKVYIIIVNYNGWTDTIECLENLSAISYPNFTVVVVDNNSSNGSFALIREWTKGKQKDTEKNLVRGDLFANFQCHSGSTLNLSKIKNSDGNLILVQAGSNKGFAAGNNIVLKHLLDEDAFVWLLNPDMVVEPGSLAALVQHAESAREQVIVGSVVKDYATRKQILFYGGSIINKWTGTTREVTDPARIGQLDYISGGSFFSSLQNFKLVGLLPEEYFLYWEETDWCLNASNKGLKMTVSLNTITYDKISTTIGKGYLAEYYYSLNALRFLYRYYPPYCYSALFFNFLRILKRISAFKFQNVKAIIDASFHFFIRKK